MDAPRPSGPNTQALGLMALFHEGTDTAQAIDALHGLGIPDDKMVVATGVPYPQAAPVGAAPAAVILFVFTMMATIVSTFLGELWEKNFPAFGPKPYHKLVTDGHLALFVDFPPDVEAEVRQVLEAHRGHHIGPPERMAL